MYMCFNRKLSIVIYTQFDLIVTGIIDVFSGCCFFVYNMKGEKVEEMAVLLDFYKFTESTITFNGTYCTLMRTKIDLILFTLYISIYHVLLGGVPTC